jgi:transcriptional regulator with PAS, ATPase and Fis domain
MLGNQRKLRAVVVRINDADACDTNVFTEIRRTTGRTAVLAWVPELTPETAFQLCYLGADEVVTDSATEEQRRGAIETARRRAGSSSIDQTEYACEPWRQSLVGASSSMRVVCELIRLVSPRRCTVLVTGETGTGKEMVARAIHAASPRASQPMVSINCNAIPSELLEAELFGHVKGAYTGAFTNRVGRFEQANRGTLFLDEIGDLPFPLQAKLLRILQEREMQRLGSSETVKVDVRIVAATNSNLLSLVEQGKFRQDLYYRLNVAPIHLPPLRERLDDIPQLALHFVEKICRSEQIPVKTVPREALDWLQTFPWPGNIRELENTIESAIAVGGDRPTLRMADFSTLLCVSTQQQRLFAMPSEGIDYNSIVGQFERTLLSEALRLAGGSKKRAASLLQLKRTTFSAKLDSLSVGTEDTVDDDSAEFLAEPARMG